MTIVQRLIGILSDAPSAGGAGKAKSGAKAGASASGKASAKARDKAPGKAKVGKKPAAETGAGSGAEAVPTPAPSFERPVATVEDDRFAYRFVCHSQKEANRANRMLNKERGTIAWLDREVRPDDVFYDVGANIGVYTIFAGRRLGPGGAVYAFEPHIPNAASLLENIFLNGLQERVRLVSSALTNGERFDRFNYHSVNSASSTSQFGGNSYEGEVFEPVFVEIKHGCSLDHLIQIGAVPPPDLIKIDVDGLDFEVLDGMSKLLMSGRGPRSIQIELGSESKPKIMALCAKAGYELREKHWSAAGHTFIEEGGDPEDYPHYGIFYRPEGGEA